MRLQRRDAVQQRRLRSVWRGRGRRVLCAAVMVAAVMTASGGATAHAGASELLLYTGPGTTFEWGSKYSSFASAAGRPMTESTSLSVDMSTYSCVLLPVPTVTFDATQRAKLSAYVAAGGTVVAIAEHSGWEPGATSQIVINALGSSLGSSMFVTGAVDANYVETTNVDPSPFTQGVNKVGLATTAAVFGGTSLVRSTSGTYPWVARQQLGAGAFVVIGDANAVSDFFSMPTKPNLDNGRLVRNLCGDIRPPAVTLVTPADGARYQLGAPIQADWFCSDLDGNNDVVSQVGTVADGALIDTGTPGLKSFTVTCTDAVGNQAHVTHTYFVDASPPTVVIDTPVDGATYNRNSTVPAAWGCEDEDGPADIDSAPDKTFGTRSPGVAIDTVMPLGGAPITRSFSVTCTDVAGNTATKLVSYTVADQNPPAVAVTTPGDGARFTIGKPITADWACSDPDGFQDIDQDENKTFGTTPDGQLIDTSGTVGQTIAKALTVTCTDLAGNTTTKTHTYYVDGNPPVVSIVVPVDGGTYPRGSNQPANWGCTDPDGDSDVKSKVATLPVGTPINTGTLGSKSFSVTCTDQAGNVATKTVTYTIIGGPPVITIVIPGDGVTFNRGQVVSPSYSCSDPDNDLKSCVREGGATGPVDTSKPGTFSFTVNAADAAGNTATKTVKYTVRPGGTVAGSTTTAPSTTKSGAKACTSRRQFRIRVKKLKGGVKATSATVYVNGKKTVVRRGKRITATVTLKGLKKGTYRVKINVKYSDGRTLTYTRKFRTCVPKGR